MAALPQVPAPVASAGHPRDLVREHDEPCSSYRSPSNICRAADAGHQESPGQYRDVGSARASVHVGRAWRARGVATDLAVVARASVVRTLLRGELHTVCDADGPGGGGHELRVRGRGCPLLLRLRKLTQYAVPAS
jgi:hypothetical protein